MMFPTSYYASVTMISSETAITEQIDHLALYNSYNAVMDIVWKTRANELLAYPGFSYLDFGVR
jgi:hypothetical protein